MITKKRQRATSKASKTTRSQAEGSRKKLAEAFIADLDRSWQQHGREALDRVRAERPEVYFKALLKLTVALHRALDKPRDFDRRRSRKEALRRLEAAREYPALSTCARPASTGSRGSASMPPKALLSLSTL
jgi:hypothetical protein